MARLFSEEYPITKDWAAIAASCALPAAREVIASGFCV
jgi:hypothetical protein